MGKGIGGKEEIEIIHFSIRVIRLEKFWKAFGWILSGPFGNNTILESGELRLRLEGIGRG